jgi:glutaminyl-peptide cyclotransferase
MYGKKAILILWGAAAMAADFSGASALEYTRRIVACGPHPPGSPAIQKVQQLIRAELKGCGCEVSEDAFTAQTPAGRLPMVNLIARFPGKSGQAVVISGHYDTKLMPRIRFLGANDGGASAGLLLEMARALSGRPHKHDIYLVWFDGEEAIAEWSATDGIYGSRHLAARWAAQGKLSRIKALINVDMIGDRNLGILQELYSSASLRTLVWSKAAQLGYGRHFLDQGSAVEDDHVPFLRRGVNALDLIDFDYGPGNSWWHTAADTMDKLSASSLQVVGKVLVETLRGLDQ